VGVTSPEPRGSGPGAIGILGGTFDPIHLGHLALAAEAQSTLGLEQVSFVPNADPPHKQEDPPSPAAHREAMVALALADHPSFILDRIELERPGPSFAVDTVAVFARRSRLEGRPEPWFLLSAEALETFHTWREPERVLDSCRIAVARRPGAEHLDRSWAARQYPGREDRFVFLSGPDVDIASTTIRARIARGEPVAGMMPESVLAYITGQRLYAVPRGVVS
jgi:nicotinate-nucleotide adenylyltransferase